MMTSRNRTKQNLKRRRSMCRHLDKKVKRLVKFSVSLNIQPLLDGLRKMGEACQELSKVMVRS